MIKPLYFVYDKEAKRYVHNTTRDVGIYSSQAVELFTRADLEMAYERGYHYGFECAFSDIVINPPINELVDELIEHDGKPYQEG